MDRMTLILIALLAVTVMLIGGIIIVDTAQKESQDAQTPSVNISQVFCTSELDHTYWVVYDYYNFYKGQTIVFFVDSHEVERVKIDPNEPSRQGRNIVIVNPPTIPTISNVSYTIIP